MEDWGHFFFRKKKYKRRVDLCLEGEILNCLLFESEKEIIYCKGYELTAYLSASYDRSVTTKQRDMPMIHSAFYLV